MQLFGNGVKLLLILYP